MAHAGAFASVLPVDGGARGIAHSDEKMGESGMELEDILGEVAKALFEGGLDLGIVFTDLRRRRRGGF
jgi:hypothetical protein